MKGVKQWDKAGNHLPTKRRDGILFIGSGEVDPV